MRTVSRRDSSSPQASCRHVDIYEGICVATDMCVCVYLYMFMCIYVYIYRWIHIFFFDFCSLHQACRDKDGVPQSVVFCSGIDADIYRYLYTYIYIYIYIYMYLYIFLYSYICIYMYVYIYTYIYIYMCVCVCVCVYMVFFDFCSLHQACRDKDGVPQGVVFSQGKFERESTKERKLCVSLHIYVYRYLY